jgi:tetratricopeptide (TPR) repeat protein
MIASGHEAHSAELLQLAQMLLAADELLDGVSHYARIGELLTRATNLSRGAIYVDATLIKARALTLRDEYPEALKILRLAKRLGDPLTRTAISIEEAHIFERKRDYWEAIRRYRIALHEAEDVAADELAARASLGWLRCDALSTLMRDKEFDAERLRLRVRCLVQVQGARAPDLFALSRRNQPIVFLSYRSKTRELTQRVNGLLKDSKLTPFLDCDSTKAEADGIWTEKRDFGAAIHKKLLDADAVVLFLSEEFFDSPWCAHELHFALGQHEVRGILIFWTWCESPPNPPDNNLSDLKSPQKRPLSPLETAREWAKRPMGEGARIGDNDYYRYHEQDRLLRVINQGRCLTDDTVRIGDSEKAAVQIVEQLKRHEAELRTRAGLQASLDVND